MLTNRLSRLPIICRRSAREIWCQIAGMPAFPLQQFHHRILMADVWLTCTIKASFCRFRLTSGLRWLWKRAPVLFRQGTRWKIFDRASFKLDDTLLIYIRLITGPCIAMAYTLSPSSNVDRRDPGVWSLVRGNAPYNVPDSWRGFVSCTSARNWLYAHMWGECVK